MKAAGSLSLAALVLLVAGVAFAQGNYVGSKDCAMCHKTGKGGTAFADWEKSQHAKAYKTLLTEEAKKIAKEKGIEAEPHTSPECLKCHVTGGGEAKNVDAKFSMEEGVGCEACHGPASGYKMIHIKGERAKSVEAGLIVANKDEMTCTKCHNDSSPTFTGFKFDEYWPKIAHSLPPKP